LQKKSGGRQGMRIYGTAAAWGKTPRFFLALYHALLCLPDGNSFKKQYLGFRRSAILTREDWSAALLAIACLK
jgi:hypothetical protein